SIGTMVAFVTYMERVYSPLRRLINSSTMLTQSIASIDRVFELMNEKYDVVDKPGAKALGRVEGTVSFEHVSFRYEDEEGDVLQNIQLDVKKGETIEIDGMRDGGKTTLVSLLTRFYDVTNGTNKVDGMDIRDVQARSLRHNIGMVLQDNLLFSESIAMNIRMGNPEATDEEVIAAAKAANAHDFIMALPYGYDTPVGE